MRNRASLSLSLLLESYELREELSKVVVLSVVDGFINEESVMEIIPSIIPSKMAGPIIALNETSFLIPFESRDEVREVVKLGEFEAMTKDGKCKLNMAYWTRSLGPWVGLMEKDSGFESGTFPFMGGVGGFE